MSRIETLAVSGTGAELSGTVEISNPDLIGDRVGREKFSTDRESGTSGVRGGGGALSFGGGAGRGGVEGRSGTIDDVGERGGETPDPADVVDDDGKSPTAIPRNSTAGV